MQTDRNFMNELKYQYNNGGMSIQLIFINCFVFLLISLLTVLGRLSGNDVLEMITSQIFTLQTDLTSFLLKPWGLLTSIFSHFTLMHLLFNMLMLFFAGKAFEQFFSGNRLLALYILGGLAGGIFEILAHALVPTMAMNPVVIVGASGSIMAIFMGLAFYKPNIPVSLFGLFQFPIIYLGIFYLVYDFISLGLLDGTAHFAHLGGAIIGIVSAQKPFDSKSFLYKFELLLVKLGNFIKSLFSHKSNTSNFGKSSSVRSKSDEDFNLDKKKRQEQVDRILDKISKSGYESLTKAEKEFLFKQSNNG